jgi:hypothetical protein
MLPFSPKQHAMALPELELTNGRPEIDLSAFDVTVVTKTNAPW